MPTRCVVDTNVPATANGSNRAASATCVAVSGRALLEVMQGGHLFIDDAGLIRAEYVRTLSIAGQQMPGTAFLKWLLTNEWNSSRVTRVPLTPNDEDGTDFTELPSPPEGVRYDPSDRKFLAVSAAHPEHPPILQALDSKWWGWREALEQAGVRIHFVCPAEIEKKHAEKMGT